MKGVELYCLEVVIKLAVVVDLDAVCPYVYRACIAECCGLTRIFWERKNVCGTDEHRATPHVKQRTKMLAHSSDPAAAAQKKESVKTTHTTREENLIATFAPGPKQESF